jgi:hypothetical protein
MTIEQQIIKEMKKKTGTTIGELVAKGFNANTARRVCGHMTGLSSIHFSYSKKKRKCRATGKQATAYIW